MTSKKFERWKLILDVCEYCPQNSSLRPLALAIKSLTPNSSGLFSTLSQGPSRQFGGCQVRLQSTLP